MRNLLLGLSLLGFLSCPVRAGLLADLLTFDGKENVLEDNSRGLIHDLDQDDALSVGDVITGLVRIDRRISPMATASLDDRNQLVIAYSFEVDEVTPIVGIPFFTVKYKSTSALTGLDIRSLLGDSHEPAGFTAWDQAALVVMEQVFGVADPANNPVSDTTTAGTALIDSVLSDASGYTLDVIAGFAEDDDFFHQLLTGPAGISIPGLRAATGAVSIGTQSGGFSSLYQNLGPSMTFAPVPATSVIDNSMSTYDIGVEGGLLFGSNQENWDFADKANFRLNVVPEPSTLGLAGLLVIGLLAGRRFGACSGGCGRK